MFVVRYTLVTIAKQRTQAKSVYRSMAANLILKTLKTIDDFNRLCSQNIETARVGSCSLERTLSALNQALVFLLSSLGQHPVLFVSLIRRETLGAPPKVIKLLTALYPKGRFVA